VSRLDHGAERPSGDPALARRAISALGGRYSTELGIDLDDGGIEIERWALAATLFGTRISSTVAMRTYRALAQAGVHTIADAGRARYQELVELLDDGGYARYDFRTARRLSALAQVVRERLDGRVGRLAEEANARRLEEALDGLPGWGPVTVRLFLRELRGLWPGAHPPVDPRALLAAQHLGLHIGGNGDALHDLERLARAAGADPRDLEAALVRLSLAHRRRDACAGGDECRVLKSPPDGNGSLP
jgi:hypothetical protein